MQFSRALTRTDRMEMPMPRCAASCLSRWLAGFVLTAAGCLAPGCSDDRPADSSGATGPTDPEWEVIQKLNTDERAHALGRRWHRLQAEMTRAEVEAIVGPPDLDRGKE